MRKDSERGRESCESRWNRRAAATSSRSYIKTIKKNRDGGRDFASQQFRSKKNRGFLSKDGLGKTSRVCKPRFIKKKGHGKSSEDRLREGLARGVPGRTLGFGLRSTNNKTRGKERMNPNSGGGGQTGSTRAIEKEGPGSTADGRGGSTHDIRRDSASGTTIRTECKDPLVKRNHRLLGRWEVGNRFQNYPRPLLSSS